ncbi:MAG: ATP-binding protein, partial [Desulfobacteraceae bacterium]
QYPFEGASNDDKSELLKDILAFANAWRRSDAYILIGVDEVRGGRSSVVGVTTHLDDAKLQQFVNSKTQRPIHFSYQQSSLNNKDIGVLHIPPQERPVYLVKGYGKLEKQTVYIRRSSSTDIAAPDEIAKMGQAIVEGLDSLPLLELQFFDSECLTSLGNSIEVETVNLSLPEDFEIPDYGVMRFPAGPNLYHTMPSVDKNRDYYRDTAVYLKKTMETSRLDFTVQNAGNVLARDVRIELNIPDPDRTLVFRDADDMPDEPSTSFLLSRVTQPVLNPDINVQRAPDAHVITAQLGKIQAKA